MPPPNDALRSAKPIDPLAGGFEIIDMAGATAEPGEPPYPYDGTPAVSTIWFRWTAEGVTEADTDAGVEAWLSACPTSDVPFYLDVWSSDTGGADYPALTQQDSNYGTGNSMFRTTHFAPEAGTVYFIRVGIPFNVATHLRVAWGMWRLGNSSDARVLEGDAGTTMTSDTQAFEGEPWEVGDVIGGENTLNMFPAILSRTSEKREWFKWTPSTDGRAHFRYKHIENNDGSLAAYLGTPDKVELLDDASRSLDSGVGTWQGLNGATLSTVTSPVNVGTHSLAVSNLPLTAMTDLVATGLLPLGDFGVVRPQIWLRTNNNGASGFGINLATRFEYYKDGVLLGYNYTTGDTSANSTEWKAARWEGMFGGPPPGTTHVRFVVSTSTAIGSFGLPLGTTILYINAPSLLRTLAAVQVGKQGSGYDADNDRYTPEIKFEVAADQEYWIRASPGGWGELEWSVHAKETEPRKLLCMATGFPIGVAVWAVDRDTGESQDWIWRGEEDGYFNLGDADAEGNLYYHDQYFNNVRFKDGRRVRPAGSEIDTQWAASSSVHDVPYGEGMRFKDGAVYGSIHQGYLRELAGKSIAKYSPEGAILDSWATQAGPDAFDLLPGGRTLLYVQYTSSPPDRIYAYDLETRADLPHFATADGVPGAGPQRLQTNDATFDTSLGNWTANNGTGGGATPNAALITRSTMVTPHAGPATMRLERNGSVVALTCELNEVVTNVTGIARYPVTPGKYYRVRLWMRKDAANANFLGGQVNLRFYSITGVQIASVDSRNYAQDFPTQDNYVPLTSDWRSVTVVMKAPTSPAAAYMGIDPVVVGASASPSRVIGAGEYAWISDVDVREIPTPLGYYQLRTTSKGLTVVLGEGEDPYSEGVWFRIFDMSGALLDQFRWLPWPADTDGNIEPPFYDYMGFCLDPDDEDYLWLDTTATSFYADEEGIDHQPRAEHLLYKIPYLADQDTRYKAMRTPFAKFGGDAQGWESFEEVQTVVATTGTFWEERIAVPSLGVGVVHARVARVGDMRQIGARAGSQ